MLNKNHRKEDNGKNNNMNLFNPQFPLQMQWGRAGTIQKYSLTFISFTWLWDFCRNTWSMSTLYQSLWWPYLHPSLRLQVLCRRLSYLPPGKLREFLQVFNFNSCLVSFFIVLCSDSLRLLCGSLVAFPPDVPLPCLQALFFPHLRFRVASAQHGPELHALIHSARNGQLETHTFISCPFSSQSDLIRH